jgi:hypothetical protein
MGREGGTLVGLSVDAPSLACGIYCRVYSNLQWVLMLQQANGKQWFGKTAEAGQGGTKARSYVLPRTLGLSYERRRYVLIHPED